MDSKWFRRKHAWTDRSRGDEKRAEGHEMFHRERLGIATIATYWQQRSASG
jgi:hypothetical protein